jgi:hypothetical protein
MIVIAVFRLAGADLTLFDAYESLVLALLPEHGGLLEHRLRNDTGTEVHVLRFESHGRYAAFRADARRLAAMPLFEKSGVRAEVHEFVPPESV